MKVFNIAIVGFGGMGGYHSGRIKSLTGFNIGGAFDINSDRMIAATECGLKAFSSHGDVAASQDVDAVLLATPNDSHRELTEFYLNAKKHVLCEKPAAITESDYLAMADTAKKNGKILYVNQNRRCDEDFLTAKSIIDGGLIGDVYRIESRVMGANGIPGDWRKYTQYGGGMMLDWGVHMLDQICLLTDSSIKSVDCKYSFKLGFEVDDGFNVRMEFQNGLTAVAELDSNCFINLPRWALYGTSGTAHIYGFDSNGKIIVNYDPSQKTEAQKRGNGLTKTMAVRPAGSIREIPMPQVMPDGNLLYNNFKDACQNGSPQLVKHLQVARILKLMEAAKSSALSATVLRTDI